MKGDKGRILIFRKGGWFWNLTTKFSKFLLKVKLSKNQFPKIEHHLMPYIDSDFSATTTEACTAPLLQPIKFSWTSLIGSREEKKRRKEDILREKRRRRHREGEKEKEEIRNVLEQERRYMKEI